MDKTIEQQLMELLRKNEQSIKDLDKKFDEKFGELTKKIDNLEVILKRFCEVD